MLYHLYSAPCQLYLHKTGRKIKIKNQNGRKANFEGITLEYSQHDKKLCFHEHRKLSKLEARKVELKRAKTYSLLKTKQKLFSNQGKYIYLLSSESISDGKKILFSVSCNKLAINT